MLVAQAILAIRIVSSSELPLRCTSNRSICQSVGHSVVAEFQRKGQSASPSGLGSGNRTFQTNDTVLKDRESDETVSNLPDSLLTHA